MSDEPQLRPGPPWAMEEMILAAPELVAPVLAGAEAAEAGELVRRAHGRRRAGRPDALRDERARGHGRRRAAARGARHARRRARDAFEAALDPQAGGVIVGVSHEPARRRRSPRWMRPRPPVPRPCSSPPGPTAPGGHLLVPTPLRDRSWCHTVGYLSPLLAFHAMAGPAPEAAARPSRTGWRAGRSTPGPATRIARCRRLLAVGSGADEIRRASWR